MIFERGSLCLVAALALGCASNGDGPTVDLSVPALQDVNSTSTTYEQAVHPNDYQGMVSAWYFGHST